MNNFLIVAGLLVGVIGSNILKQFMPKIPEAFILTLIGVGMSFIPIFKNFELQPELFMLIIIAPLMFIEGQKQSFKKIKKNFSRIIALSVYLSLVSAILVGTIANHFEVGWTLPMSLALAAIIIPTDAVAVKSITKDEFLPESVDDDLQLESLFNDAVGLVILDLSLSVMHKGTFSLSQGITHFLVVAVGGIIVGLAVGYAFVMLRFILNEKTTNSELMTIPISLLTPFVVYLVAEKLGVSGILAVVATGIGHNWESDKLRLTATNVQLASRTIWNIFTDILNDFVFLILGMSLLSVWNDIKSIGTIGILQLVGLGILLYYSIVLLRYLWMINALNLNNEGNVEKKDVKFLSAIFSLSGIHGTMTLAMAFSLPTIIAGHQFPYRNELILVATIIIIVSMLTASIVLPRMLPKRKEDFSTSDLEDVRNKMVDHTILQIKNIIDDHDARESVTMQLQSQKNNIHNIDRAEFSANYDLLLKDTQEVIFNLLQEYNSSNKYGMNTISIYEKITQRSLSNSVVDRGFKAFVFKIISNLKHNYKRIEKEVSWHVSHKVITKKQREEYRKNILKNDSKYAKRVKSWGLVHSELLALNDDVIEVVDKYLDDVLKQRMDRGHKDNDFIYMVRRIMERLFNGIKHRYSYEAVKVDDDVYIQVFQKEYDFVRNAVNSGKIPQSMASVLYTEINQAQLLQLYQE